MNESKIDLTDRLRREGRWAEASKFKDAVVRELRAQGMRKTEAVEEAWRRMGSVDCFTIGFTSIAQFDETVEMIEQALA